MTEESNEGGVDARKDVLDGMYSSMYIEQSSIGTDIGTSKTAELESNTVDFLGRLSSSRLNLSDSIFRYYAWF